MPGYDESRMLRENAEEFGLPGAVKPVVERRAIQVDARTVSALIWGSRPLPKRPHMGHGRVGAGSSTGRDRPAPGHGHSDWKVDLAYPALVLADDVAAAMQELVPTPTVLVGMSAR